MDELKTLIKQLEHRPPKSLARQRLRLLEATTRKPRWTPLLLTGRATRGLARTPGLPGLMDSPPPARRRAPRTVLRMAAVGALGLAITAGITVAQNGSGAPAYAIVKNPDGTITVEFKAGGTKFTTQELSRRMQEDLRASGVPTVVNFMPSDKMCKEPRARYRPEQKGQDLVEYSSDPGALKVIIHRERIMPGQTVVLIYKGENGMYAMEQKIAEGPVAACQLVDDPEFIR